MSSILQKLRGRNGDEKTAWETQDAEDKGEVPVAEVVSRPPEPVRLDPGKTAISIAQILTSSSWRSWIEGDAFCAECVVQKDGKLYRKYLEIRFAGTLQKVSELLQ